MYEQDELDLISICFKTEFDSFKFDRAAWLHSQMSEFSQFGVEVNPEPSEDTLMGLGRLVWSSSLFEEKISRCVFWLSSFLQGEIQELPGQGSKLVSRLGQLNKLLNDTKIADLVGLEGVGWTRSTMKDIVESIDFRDDVIHGHHLGGWYSEHVFRSPGKKFVAGNSTTVHVNAEVCMKHSDRFLEAAALLALYDHHFDTLENG